MLAHLERYRTTRLVLALALAVLVSVRGGGIALMCDGATGTPAARSLPGNENVHRASMSGMAGMAATEAEGTRQTDCDAPDQARECALMAACAPALLQAATDADVVAVPESLATAGPVRMLASVDRSPDPPPPRS
jgi:hypothetical protein